MIFPAMKKRLWANGIALLTALALPAVAQAETWRMVSAYPETNFHTQNIGTFIKAVKAETGGAESIRLFANSSIYKAPEILAAVGDGQVQLGEIFLAAYANEDPLLGADAVSYLVSGYEGAAKLDAATRELLATHLEAKGVKLLYTVPWPPAGFYSSREIGTVEDLNGMKIRSASPITKAWTDEFGMQTVVIQVPELAQAFATGAVEAMFTASALAPAIKAWEFTPYFYDLQAVLTRNAVVMNLATFNGLDAKTQAAVLAAAKTAEDAGWVASRAADEANKALMAENGMQVLAPSPELERGLKAAAAKVIAGWLPHLDAASRAAIEGLSQ